MTGSLHDAERRFEAIVERVYEPPQCYAQRRCAHAVADDLKLRLRAADPSPVPSMTPAVRGPDPSWSM